MSDRTIYRYEVPVDDRWHTLRLSGAVLHVASRDPRAVEVWALETGGPTVDREFIVIGTGHPWPDDNAKHVGTALTSVGLVWHLLERR